MKFLPLPAAAFCISVAVSAFSPLTRTTTRSSTTITAIFASTLEQQQQVTTSENSLEQPAGQVIADGTIVSYFPGGLAAVQINDDIPSTPPPTTSSSSSSPSSSSLFSASIPNEPKAGNQGNDVLGKEVVFENGSVGVVVAQRFPIAFVLMMDTTTSSHNEIEGTVQVLDRMASVNMDLSDSCGKVVDCFGRSPSLLDDGTTTTSTSTERAMFAPIPKVADIGLINSPLITGTTMVDALAPLGKGQNMLVVGSELNIMQHFCRDLLKTQLRSTTGGKEVHLVYGATNTKTLQKLKDIADKITIVTPRQQQEDSKQHSVAAAQAAESVAVAATACAIGEAHALEGKDALVMIDSIDDHKVLWDATTRVMVDVYGVDAVVQADREGGASSEMRAYYSSLIQRAGKFKPSKGNGSMTLCMLTTLPSDSDTDDGDKDERIFTPQDFEECSDKIKTRVDILVQSNIALTSTNLKKISIPIPSSSCASEHEQRLALQHVEDLISMSDGQIWFNDEGTLDPQRSITRVGIGADTASRADAPAIQKVVGGLRLDLAQSLNMDGAEDTTATIKQEQQRNAWLLAMNQDTLRNLSESCVALLAAQTGYLTKQQHAHAAATKETVQDLLHHVKQTSPQAMQEIDETLDMSDAVQTELQDAIESFFS